MRGVGPFGPGRQVVAGVSGGADSMALALLLRGWGDLLAVVVDHGLRAASAGEAAVTMERLAGLGIGARLMTLPGLLRGADLGARARAARYAALLRACREAGRPDLLMAHHAQDQAETVLLRQARGSGAAGLAGMAAVAWRGDARVLRPLLAVAPDRLRATLRAAGVGWVEDPSNQDPASARGALRAERAVAAPIAPAAGSARRAEEVALARELGLNVSLHPTGHAAVRGRLSVPAWSALIWTVSGRPYPPSPRAVKRLADRLTQDDGGTLHGVVVRDGLVVREAAALRPAVAANAGASWDGRFMLRHSVVGGRFGAFGSDAGRLRQRRGPPSAILGTLPLVRLGADLLMSMHLDYLGDGSWPSVEIDFRPARPLAGAPFLPG